MLNDTFSASFKHREVGNENKRKFNFVEFVLWVSGIHCWWWYGFPGKASLAFQNGISRDSLFWWKTRRVFKVFRKAGREAVCPFFYLLLEIVLGAVGSLFDTQCILRWCILYFLEQHSFAGELKETLYTRKHVQGETKIIDLNTRDSLGRTQFMKACIIGHKEVVKWLNIH